MADVPEPDTVGSAHWVRVAKRAHEAIRQPINDAKTEHLAGVLERFEQDLAPHLASLLAGIAENPNVPEPIRTLVAELAAPQHFTSSLLVGMGIGAVLSPVIQTATAPFVQVLANEVWPTEPSVPLSPPEMATAVLKGIATETQAKAEALLSGVDNARMQTLIDVTGEAIGIEEAILLWRRGDIDEAELERVVHYSNVRSDFLPDIKKLRYLPPTAGEVVSGRLKDHLSDAEYATKLSNAGIDPAEGAWLLATAGRPYGPGEALDLWNRGEITEADVDQVIAQSDMNPLFGPAFKKLRRYLPPPRSVVPLLRSGAISETYARQLLEMHGLDQTDADAFVAEAMKTKTSAAKELSMAQVLKLYENRYIDANEATARLAALKYPQDEITLLLQSADDARHLAYVDAVLARVHARYVAYKLTEAEVHSTLAADGVAPTAIADYLSLWNLERGANYHALAPAAIVGAYRREEIGPAETKARLLEVGVQLADMAIVLADGWPPTKPPSRAVIDAVLSA